MSRTAELQARFEAAFMPNYGVPPVALVRGEGCQVWDADGNQYTDLIAGIAVSALGHAHPALTEAVTRQVRAIAHTSNLFLHETEVALAERLLRLLGGDGRVFFANSGTEANEAALKLVRRHQGPSRPVIVAAENSFHGRTMGSLAVTGKAGLRQPFGPFGFDVRFVPYGDLAALTSAVTRECAAVILEPCQGEAGVVPPPAGYLRGAREACDAAGALLVIDEIQSGIGRTGAWFACQAAGVVPDVLTLAKGLGGGLPIGACIGLGAAGTALRKGDHGSTFGGNPVACAAALAVLATIESEGLLARAAAVGRQAGGRHRRDRSSAAGRGPGRGPVARRGADPARRRCGGGGLPGRGLPGQRRAAGRHPAGTAAHPRRRRGSRVPRRAPGHPGRGPRPRTRPRHAAGEQAPAAERVP